MTKTKKQKPITHDLFGIDECVICDGEGKKTYDVYNLNDWSKVAYTKTEDCDNCNGTGIEG